MADIIVPAPGPFGRRRGGNASSFGKYEQPDDGLLQEGEKQRAFAASEHCTFVLRPELHGFRADFFKFVI